MLNNITLFSLSYISRHRGKKRQHQIMDCLTQKSSNSVQPCPHQSNSLFNSHTKLELIGETLQNRISNIFAANNPIDDQFSFILKVMTNVKIKSSPEVQEVFKTYPARFRKKLLALRALIIESAEELPEVKEIEETLKWGEPSYLVEKGSTVRIAWKEKKPRQVLHLF